MKRKKCVAYISHVVLFHLSVCPSVGGGSPGVDAVRWVVNSWGGGGAGDPGGFRTQLGATTRSCAEGHNTARTKDSAAAFNFAHLCLSKTLEKNAKTGTFCNMTQDNLIFAHSVTCATPKKPYLVVMSFYLLDSLSCLVLQPS